MYYVSRLSIDALGTFQAPVLARTSVGFYDSFSASDPDRWGDYSAVVIDPTDDCFWVAQEFVFTSGVGTSRWGTHIVSFCPEPYGACCFDDRSCTVEVLDDCNTLGGTYQGDGTDCTPNPCLLPCPADLVVDGAVDVKDLLFLLGAWGPCPEKGDCPADLVVDGAVDVKDLLFLLGAWGPCPGPPQLVYSHEFVNGVIYCPGDPQYDDWLSYRASLPTSGVMSITASGSQDPTGRTCSDPTVAQQIADAMRTGATLTVECGGFTWEVSGGGCQIGCGLPDNDLVLSVGGGFCSCDVASIIRPGIGNENWGGIAGNSCFAPTQTMTVTIE